MIINVTQRPTRNGSKIYYTLEWGKGPGERKATGLFTYAKPKDQIQRNHNKETLVLLEKKQSQLIIEQQSVGSAHIPFHKFKTNFLDYYEEYVRNNLRPGNRHMEGSFRLFKEFLRKDFLTPVDLTENLCFRFRKFLLDRYTGDTPANYFARFKRCVKSATKDGYFRFSPAEDIAARSNPSRRLKEVIEVDEYLILLKAPCVNPEVKEAFVLSCYTGLRWIDVKKLSWPQIDGDTLKTTIIQSKTGRPLVLTLHPIARAILENRRNRIPPGRTSGKVFELPCQDGCNKTLQQWVTRAGIKKQITWHCARLSFSVLLQDANVDNATVSLLLGQTSTKYVDQIYRRARPKNAMASLTKLPGGEIQSVILN